MRWLIIVGLLLSQKIATSQMIRNDAIGNDPDKERLCVARAADLGTSRTIPFEIDSGYLAQERKEHPEVVFVALDVADGTLVRCELRETTGRFEPSSYGAANWYWHPIRPEKIGIDTELGRRKAVDTCLKGVVAKARSTYPNFDHSVDSQIVEVDMGTQRNLPGGHAVGDLVAGMKAERYDVIVRGKSFYGRANPDFSAAPFECLLSPMLELKAIKVK